MYHASSRSSQALKLTPIKRDPTADDETPSTHAATAAATTTSTSTTTTSTTGASTDLSAEAANKKPMPAPRPSAAATAAAAAAAGGAAAGGGGSEPAPLPAKPTKKINPPPTANDGTLSRESTIASVPSHDALEKLAATSAAESGGGGGSSSGSNVVVGRRNVMATARFDSKTRTPKELEFKKGDTILILEATDAEWWKAQKGFVWMIVSSYVQCTIFMSSLLGLI